MERDRCSLEEARLRVAAQLSFDEKKRHADFVIDTSGERETTLAQADRLVEEIQARVAAR